MDLSLLQDPLRITAHNGLERAPGTSRVFNGCVSFLWFMIRCHFWPVCSREPDIFPGAGRKGAQVSQSQAKQVARIDAP